MCSLFQDCTEAAHSTKQQEPKKVESWQKSVGTLSSKSSLASLVKRKPSSKGEASKSSPSSGAGVTKSSAPSTAKGTVPSAETQRLVASALSKQAKAQDAVKTSTTNGLIKPASKADPVARHSGGAASPAVAAGSESSLSASAAGSALGLLGGYLGSDSDSSSS